MPLLGQGFLIMWHDISAEAEQEYHLWHTRQHMPERLSIPGFLRGRRGVNGSREFQRILTIYEGAALQVFRGPEYLRRLNNPTPWTARLAPSFRNFLRVACETVASEGVGVGGAIGTWRARFGPRTGEAELVRAASTLCGQMMAMPDVSAVHVAVVRPEVAAIRTAEAALRAAPAADCFDTVVLVEGLGLRELDGLSGGIEQVLGGGLLIDLVPQTYEMAFMLDSPLRL